MIPAKNPPGTRETRAVAERFYNAPVGSGGRCEWRTFGRPVLERRGSIDGFNSVLLASPDFSTVLLILCNTDTGDLEKMGDALYRLLK